MDTLINLFKNPVVGIIGSLASTVSLILAVYFYSISIESKELTYYVHPVKSSIVSAKNIRDLDVLYKGQSLARDITVVKIAFWNAGNSPIRANDILVPLQIEISDSKILEATVSSKNRDILDIILDSSEFIDGKVSIKWNVLEKKRAFNILCQTKAYD